MRRRIFSLLCLFSVVMMLLAGRLFWLQVLAPLQHSRESADFAFRSFRQRSERIVLDSGRGHFYDRHGRPLTGQNIYGALVIPSEGHFRGNNSQVKQLADILRVPTDALHRFLSGLSSPAFVPEPGGSVPLSLDEGQIRQLEGLRIPGLYVLPTVIRYPDGMIARHLIGFLGENEPLARRLYGDELARGFIAPHEKIGVAGLEKTLERYLHGWLPKEAYLYVDGRKNVLKGLGLRTDDPGNPYYPMRVVLTLDGDLQSRIENILDAKGLAKGAVVVLDARNADVLAMASRPQFDPNRLRPEDDAWSNRAVKALAPGSVFKTVVAAALLEDGELHAEDRFFCGGRFAPYAFSCWKKEGHGWLTAREAYAQSCNVAFAQMMMRMDADRLEDMAKKLGLGLHIGWREETGGGTLELLEGEEKGQIFDEKTDRHDVGVKIQTAIGQRDVLISPLQGANLVVTLLNGGKTMRPRVVKEIQYRDGSVKVRFGEQSLKSRALSEKTAHQVAAWMVDVVKSGTGRSLQTARWPVAGKTGTAEVGDGTVHQWFVGFGPVNDPRYAVAVAAESMPAGAPNLALEIFREVMNVLAVTEDPSSDPNRSIF